jgi:hypothetical protein
MSHLDPNNKKRIPKKGAGFAFLRILGDIAKGSGILVLAGSVAISCYGSFRALQSFLPYREQKMAGFVTTLYFSYILIFFICLSSLGAMLVAGGIALKFAGTRKRDDAAAVNDAGEHASPMGQDRDESSRSSL